MNTIEIDVQIESNQAGIPTQPDLIKWTKAALTKNHAEITIRVVDETESAHLNTTYRHKSGPTNVLSFPMVSVHAQELLLGDIVICAPLVYQEALEQQKTCQDHWAHLVIHGVLHLQGYDHEHEDDAKIMEAQEIKILSKLGITNPYD